ncbi:MAG TPA: hypothetical protein ENH94_06975 [Phycisphaerales bacterium]|nr:hypothetical protein [Phycisphaerales bacterium]
MKCSEEFNKVLTYTGTYISATCEFCGRVHFFSGDMSGWDEYVDGRGQLEVLQKKAEAELGKYIDWGNVSVAFGHIYGKQYVVGCPCNKLYKYEEFIWDHREMIMEYYKLRYATMQKDAQLLGEQIKEATESVDT